MNKHHFKLALFAIVAVTLTLSSCTKDPAPTPEPEQEEFDGARIQFIKLNSSGDETTDTLAVDFDASGSPSNEVILNNGLSYRMLITLLLRNESQNQDVIDEGTLHQFFFDPTVPGILDYVYADADANGDGIGLDGKMTVNGTGSLQLKVVLRHGLDKSNPAAEQWNSQDYNAAGGEDDLNVTFRLKAE
jgi:hypothetical protein